MWLSFGTIDFFFFLLCPCLSLEQKSVKYSRSQRHLTMPAFGNCRQSYERATLNITVLSMRNDATSNSYNSFKTCSVLSSQIWAEVICWIVYQLLKRSVYCGLVFITECSRNAAKFQLLPSCVQHVLQCWWAKWKFWRVNPENMPYKVPKSNQKCNSKPSNVFLSPLNPFNLFFS